jgi:proline iminopeptidase
LIHGRRDLVCRPDSAWLARRALPSARLQWVAGAGHDPYAPAMARAVSTAARRFAAHGDFRGLGQ